MVIRNFQLGSVIDHPTENPCVVGSIPTLAINLFNRLQTSIFYPQPDVSFIVPLTLQKSPFPQSLRHGFRGFISPASLL